MKVKIGDILIAITIGPKRQETFAEHEAASVLLTKQLVILRENVALEVEVQRLRKLKGKGNGK